MTADTPRPPTVAARTAPEEDVGKVVGAFLLALSLYLGVAFGVVVQEKVTLDADIAAAETVVVMAEDA